MLSYKLENNSYRLIYNSLENYMNIIKDHFDENAKTSALKQMSMIFMSHMDSYGE